ncbi:MAG: hypothetical protein IJC85_02280 [Oscillospiraceae bacterium]|nr:hypothetical protein [Oscillospiraceae bacterium]
MKRPEQTKTEMEYKRFDKISKIVFYPLSILTIASIILFVLVKSDELKLLFSLFLLFDTIAIILVASKINNKRNAFLQLLKEEREGIVRTGLFEEIYNAYKYDGFEFNLIYDKLLFEEYYNNIIEIGVQKDDHEFFIMIDEKAISIIVDEETDCPIEKEIPLSNIATMEQVYSVINDVLSQNESV